MTYAEAPFRAGIGRRSLRGRKGKLLVHLRKLFLPCGARLYPLAAKPVENDFPHRPWAAFRPRASHLWDVLLGLFTSTYKRGGVALDGYRKPHNGDSVAQERVEADPQPSKSALLGMMKVTIRPADLEGDRRSLIGLYREHLNPHMDEVRFDWMYSQSPHGKASAWVLVVEETKELMGAAAAFPRQMYAHDNEIRGYVLGDFCIHPALRTLGPAVQLQRACLEGVAATPGALWYDFPSDAMTAVYRRMGLVAQTSFVRLAKPLRADRALAGKVKSRPVRRLIGAATNSALRTRDSLRRRDRGAQIARHEGACGYEFTKLALEAQKSGEVYVANTAEHLNWRFLANPFQQFDILAARSESALLGYVVVAHEGNDARIVSFRSLDDEHVGRDLVLSAIDSMRALGVETISASLLAQDPRIGVFEGLGFRRRESRPVVFSALSRASSEGAENSEAPWHLMDGDRD
jgi:hypothetical protein